MTVSGPITKRCPYKHEVDDGTVTLTFDVADDGDGPELHALAQGLGHFRDDAISHEAFTRLLLNSTQAVEVVTRWTTAGLDVTCRATR